MTKNTYNRVSAPKLEELLSDLEEELKIAKIKASLYIVGGAAIALGKEQLVPNRLTDDVDVRLDLFTEDNSDDAEESFFRLVKKVGIRHKVRPDWLNNEGKSLFCGEPLKATANGQYLKIKLATPEQLLAMKVIAGRGKDHRDTKALIEYLEVNANDIKAILLANFSKDYLEKKAVERGLRDGIDSMIALAIGLTRNPAGVSESRDRNEFFNTGFHINDKGERKPCNAILRTCRFFRPESG